MKKPTREEEEQFKKDSEEFEAKEEKVRKYFTSIIAINMTEHRYQVFSQRGILLKENDFSK